MTTVLSEGVRQKTRKDHVCCICGDWIPKGSTCHYQTNTGTEESDFGTAYWHSECGGDGSWQQ